MGLTTKTGNSGLLATVVGVTPPTTNIFNYSSGPGVLRQIYCQLPSNQKVLKIRITVDGKIIYEDILENLESLCKSIMTHQAYRLSHELDLHFTNSLDITIFGAASSSSVFNYRVTCICICNV